MAFIIALVAVGVYLKVFLPPVEKRDGMALFILAFWSLNIFGVVMVLLGGDLGPLNDVLGSATGSN